MDSIIAYKLHSGAIFTDKGRRVSVTHLELTAPSGLQAGDKIKVTGKSKGRGFSGVVKRHGFAGVGGRTHGQSDRQRHPGSIGMRTTPGRVWKGKRMAGRYGNETVAVKNLQVVTVDDKKLTITGTVPGYRRRLVKIVKLSGKTDNGQN